MGLLGGALVNRISALLKETPEAPLPLPPCEDTARRPSVNQEEGLTGLRICWHLDFGIPRLWEVNLSIIIKSQVLLQPELVKAYGLIFWLWYLEKTGVNFSEASEFSGEMKKSSGIKRVKKKKKSCVFCFYLPWEKQLCCGFCHNVSDLTQSGVGNGFVNYKTLSSHSKTMGYIFHFANFYGICEELGCFPWQNIQREDTKASSWSNRLFDEK